MGRLLGQALAGGRYTEAGALMQPLDEFWDVRGLGVEADGWVDRCRAALEHAPAGRPRASLRVPLQSARRGPTPNNWEPEINQADRPYISGNHFAKCGKISIFERGSSAVRYAEFDTVNQCSFPGQERRCNINTAQVCTLVGGAKVWQDVQNCVQSRQLCQTTTGACCTPSNGFSGSNRNCF
jgi:hypothetical protein